MAFTLALSLVGCGVNITGVSLNLPDTIEKGTAIVATPEYAFDGATPETAELEKKLDKLEMHYTSSDPSILVVDDNGNLVAVSSRNTSTRCWLSGKRLSLLQNPAKRWLLWRLCTPVNEATFSCLLETMICPHTYRSSSKKAV